MIVSKGKGVVGILVPLFVPDFQVLQFDEESSVHVL